MIRNTILNKYERGLKDILQEIYGSDFKKILEKIGILNRRRTEAMDFSRVIQ